MRAAILWLAVGLFSSSLPAADEAFASGLRHTIITNAYFSTDPGDPLTVFNTGATDDGSNYVYGIFGASIHLGGMEGGVFVTVNCQKEDGWAMDGVSYGTVGGVTNSWLGSVTGTRNGFGWYDVLMDFSPLGATSYTYQVFYHDLMSLVVTNAGPHSVVDASSYGPPPPRINPIWIKGSRVGVVVDFESAITEFRVPGFHAYGSRMVILAENPTNTVEEMSRLDVFGRNGLPAFTFQSERPGKFGLYHQTLGGVRLHATPSQLTVSNLDASALQGLFTELPQVQTFRASLLPRELTNETFTVLASFTGTSSQSPYGKFLGDVQLSRAANVVSLTSGQTGLVARVFANGVPAGSIVTSNGGIGTVLGTNLVLTSYAAAATGTNEPAHLGFRFASAVTLSNAEGTVLTGDEIRVSTTSPDEIVGALTAIAFTGLNLDQITITGMETFAPEPEPLRLRFAREGNTLRLSWPFSPDYYLATNSDVTDSNNWQNVSSGIYTYTNFQTRLAVPLSNQSNRFFQLRHYNAGYLVTPIED